MKVPKKRKPAKCRRYWVSGYVAAMNEVIGRHLRGLNRYDRDEITTNISESIKRVLRGERE